MALRKSLLFVLLACAPAKASGQVRSMTQDSTLNNLEHAAGTATAAWGTLGRVRKLGEGRRVLLLIPGFGFGDDVWAEFMERNRAEYTMYAVTLPGFGGTRPLPMPAQSMSYAEAPWARSAVRGIIDVLDRERVDRVTLVAHWAMASQIALELALDHADRVESVILIGGVLKAHYASTPAMASWTPEQRASYANAMATRWFRTVTRQTWDDNNFMSYDYAVNPLRGLFLWREAQAPTLPVWIRYLLEFNAVDLTPRLRDLRVPVLVVQPGFDDPGFYVDAGRDYMRDLCVGSWSGAADLTERLTFVTIPGSRLFIMYDRPDDLDREIARFLEANR
jgi:pimeloyl-ACP methyl ester carboxylesterase